MNMKIWLLCYVILAEVVVIGICVRVLVDYYGEHKKRSRQNKKSPGQPDKAARMPFHFVRRLCLFFRKDGKQLGRVDKMKTHVPRVVPTFHGGEDFCDPCVHNSVSPNVAVTGDFAR